MAKTLRQFKELYEPKAADEKKFADKHVVKKMKDQNGNDDKLFKATNIKPVKRATEHGYETVGQHDDEKVYEENVVEKKLTPAEMKKREEVAKAIERENPKMPMGKKMAIATATAKKVAEEAEQTNEEAKGVVDKSGAVHTPMSRARHLARMALQKQMQNRDKEVEKKTNQKKKKDADIFDEEVNFEAIREYLRQVYEGRLDGDDQQALNEMLETDEGTKLAFVITYFSEEE